MYDPKFLEERIKNVLQDEAQINALDFAAFLQTNEFICELNEDETIKHNPLGWNGAIGGVVGNSIGYMYFDGSTKNNEWCIFLNSYDFGDVNILNNETKETIWSYLNKCCKCNDNWANCRGGNKTILGKTFDDLCHSPLMFKSPKAETLVNVKNMLLLLKK